MLRRLALTAVLLTAACGEKRGEPRAAAPDSAAIPQPIRLPDLPDSGALSRAAVSPDGRWFALSLSHGDEVALWLVESATGKGKRILPPGGEYMDPSFSPDGRMLAYTERGATVKVLDLTTGREHEVWRGDRDHYALDTQWSPGFSLLFLVTAFDTVPHDGHVPPLIPYVVDSLGATPAPLSDEMEGHVLPAYSPDGNTVAFAAPCCNVWGQALVAVQAESRRGSCLAGPLEGIESPLFWAPEGDEIYFLGKALERNAEWEAVAVRTSGGARIVSLPQHGAAALVMADTAGNLYVPQFDDAALTHLSVWKYPHQFVRRAPGRAAAPGCPGAVGPEPAGPGTAQEDESSGPRH